MLFFSGLSPTLLLSSESTPATVNLRSPSKECSSRAMSTKPIQYNSMDEIRIVVKTQAGMNDDVGRGGRLPLFYA